MDRALLLPAQARLPAGAVQGGRPCSRSFPAPVAAKQAHRGSATSRELTCGAQKTFREGGSDAEGGGGGGGGSSGAGASQPEPPTPFDLENSPVLLQHCMERARRAVKKIEGQNFVPLEEAARFFEAGLDANIVPSLLLERMAASEQAVEACGLQTDRLGEEVLMMSDQVLTMTDEVQRRIEQEHELVVGGLYEYAQDLGRQLAGTEADSGEEGEQKMKERHGGALGAPGEGAPHGQVQQLEQALRAAQESKRRWKARALQAERQYSQLSGMIEHRLEEARAWSRELQRLKEQDETLAAAQLRRSQMHELEEGGTAGEGGQSMEEGEREREGQPGTPAPPAPAVVPRRNARMRKPNEG